MWPPTRQRVQVISGAEGTREVSESFYGADGDCLDLRCLTSMLVCWMGSHQRNLAVDHRPGTHLALSEAS